MKKLYKYVGPEEIRKESEGKNTGTVIRHPEDVLHWAKEQNLFNKSNDSLVITFVIDEQKNLRIAHRNSEHIACASGGNVYSAGEMTFYLSEKEQSVIDVTNQSTGYCPEPSSWDVVNEVLDNIGIEHPGCFTVEFIFRRCEKCGQKNIVKNEWFYCSVCNAELNPQWNF